MKRDAEFLRKVTELAAENNMGATAKALKKRRWPVSLSGPARDQVN